MSENELKSELIIGEGIPNSPTTQNSGIEKFTRSFKSSFAPALSGFEQRYKKGLLHMNILFVIALYNFVFFQSSDKKEFYVFFPFIVGGLAFITQYWNVRTRFRAYLGTSFILLGLYWDIFVSISYIPDPDGGFDFDTLPTLILDLIGCIIAAFWLENRSKFDAEFKKNY